MRANAKKAEIALKHGEHRPMIDPDEIIIDIKRKATKEHAVFKLLPGDRSDNYRVYVNDKLTGIMGITKVSEGIRKALPRFMSEASLYN
jgi:hypothetical protein